MMAAHSGRLDALWAGLWQVSADWRPTERVQLRLCWVSGLDFLSCGDACVDGLAEREGHTPVSARSLDDADKERASGLAYLALVDGAPPEQRAQPQG
jgi:hypothetical protein